jgi:hypothetical protein
LQARFPDLVLSSPLQYQFKTEKYRCLAWGINWTFAPMQVADFTDVPGRVIQPFGREHALAILNEPMVE